MNGEQDPRLRRVRLPGPFRLEYGSSLPWLDLAWRSWGRLDADGGNAVLICHALTGDAHADDWWAPLFGPGRALDPARDFIVCANTLGSCYGSSGPCSRGPDGRDWGAWFPAVTIRDQVRAQRLLLQHLGVKRLRLVVGGSLGGLQALEWAFEEDIDVAAIASIAASGRHSAWCLAWSEAQRLALRADPKFRDGHYPPEDPPRAGLAAARAIAMATYRSAASLERRLGRRDGQAIFGARAKSPGDYAVRGWLRHHGEALVQRFDANAYLRLIDAMDSHDLGRGRGGTPAALARVRQPVLVVSIPSDALYVPADQQALVDALPDGRLAVLDSMHGHDGFLIDAARLEPLLHGFRQQLEAPGLARLSA